MSTFCPYICSFNEPFLTSIRITEAVEILLLKISGGKTKGKRASILQAVCAPSLWDLSPVSIISCPLLIRSSLQARPLSPLSPRPPSLLSESSPPSPQRLLHLLLLRQPLLRPQLLSLVLRPARLRGLCSSPSLLGLMHTMGIRNY